MKMAIALTIMLLATTAQTQGRDGDIQRALKEAVATVAAAADAAGSTGDEAADAGSDDLAATLAAPEGPIVDAAAAYSGYFDPFADAMADVDAALAAARVGNGRHVLLILGGDWCHDSMALEDVLNIPRTQAMISARYEVVRVHVPFSRSERVLPVAQRFGIAQVEGTPTVLILRADGTPVNLEDAPRWRNAASRKPAAIHRALERAVPAIAP
jgi:Thioredoxin-like